MKRFIITFFIFVLSGCLIQVYAEKQPEMRRVYIFGFAASFTDSTACQTVVQTIDSAWIDGHKFLVDRSLYGLQMQNYMETQEHSKNSICSIFFDTNPRKLQRIWRRVRKRYEKSQGLQFKVIGEDRFHFIAEEYKPIIMEDTQVPATIPSSGKDSQPDNAGGRSIPPRR